MLAFETYELLTFSKLNWKDTVEYLQTEKQNERT